MFLKKLMPAIVGATLIATAASTLANNASTQYTTNDITIIRLQGDGLPNALANQLQLSPKQRYEIETIITKSHKKMKPIKQQLSDQEDQIKTMIILDYNKSQLKDLTESTGKLLGQKEFIEIDAKHQIFSVLTPMQRHQVKQFILHRAYTRA